MNLRRTLPLLVALAISAQAQQPSAAAKVHPGKDSTPPAPASPPPRPASTRSSTTPSSKPTKTPRPARSTSSASHDAATQMGLKTTGPGARTVEYKSGTVRVFNPATDCYDTVTRPGVETYLTLGFGGSGKDLAKAWEITDLGPETLDNTKVEKLDLLPRDPGVKANITKMTLWIDLTRGSLVEASPTSSLERPTNRHLHQHPPEHQSRHQALHHKRQILRQVALRQSVGESGCPFYRASVSRDEWISATAVFFSPTPQPPRHNQHRKKLQRIPRASELSTVSSNITRSPTVASIAHTSTSRLPPPKLRPAPAPSPASAK